MNELSERLIEWYINHKRDLPWRRTQDPYFIWVSEIIFQQTRIDQGLSYYERFVDKFPNVNDLASADEETVLKCWQGLGYYSRARNMHFSSKYIVNELNGVFPATYDEILKLKGVGKYTAAAIASISFNLPYPVIDGNVQRLISRLFGIQEAVNSSVGMRLIEEHIKKIFLFENPGDFNQAMMEFGARICKPQNPKCANCILNKHCQAYNTSMVEKLPNKIKNKKPKDLFLYYYVIGLKIKDKQHYYFKKRGNKGIWRSLYDFPLVESDRELERSTLIEQAYILDLLSNNEFKVLGISDFQKHQLSHKNIKACFILLNLKEEIKSSLSENYQLTEASKMNELPVPKLIANYINTAL